MKTTLEKVVYQLELVAKTLQLMEQRVVDSEDKLQDMMTYIKMQDLEYVSTVIKLTYFIVTTYCQHSPLHEQVRRDQWSPASEPSQPRQEVWCASSRRP